MDHIVNQKLTSNILNSLKECDALHESKLVGKQLENRIYSVINKTLDEHQKTESKRVNILLSDLRGFTAISEMYSAFLMIEMLNRYFLVMSEIILKYNGTIDKFMGDAIMALFGAPQSAPDDLERTIACAIEMQLAMSHVNKTNKACGMPPLYMGIGINTGQVVAGNLGSDLHSEYTVIGDEVNLTSRVEAHSLRGQILLSENSYKQARKYIEVGAANEVHVKGKQNVIRMYELWSTLKPCRLSVPCREIRKSPRVEVDMPLAFQCLEGKKVLPMEHRGKITDISYGGMLVIAPLALPPHGEIKIVLSFSLMEHRSSDVYARVISTRESNGQYASRLEFSFIDENTKTELKDHVDNLIERL